MNEYWRWLAPGLLILGLVLAPVQAAQATTPGQTAEEGEALFQKYCAGCHTIGGGDLAGRTCWGRGSTRPGLAGALAGRADVMIAEGTDRAGAMAQNNGVAMLTRT